GQNVVGTAKHDLLGVVDRVYWNGFDPHNAFTRWRLLNAAFLKGVRFMSGVGKPPPPGVEVEGPRRHTLHVDELVVGAGRNGLLRRRGALRLLGGHKVLPGRRVVAHGAPLPKPVVALLQNAGAEVVGHGMVTAARGLSCVEAAQVNGDWVECDAILCNLPGTP